MATTFGADFVKAMSNMMKEINLKDCFIPIKTAIVSTPHPFNPILIHLILTTF